MLSSEEAGPTKWPSGPFDANEHFWRSLILSELDCRYPRALQVSFHPPPQRIPRLVRICLSLPYLSKTLERAPGKDEAVTVLIVDDDAGFRKVVRRMLESGGFKVVAEASNATEADKVVAKLSPELVLVDVQLPGEDGLELTRRLTSRPTSPAVVLISSRDARDYGRRLGESGARGFIPKAGLSWQAVDALMQGEGPTRR